MTFSAIGFAVTASLAAVLFDRGEVAGGLLFLMTAGVFMGLFVSFSRAKP